MVDHEYEGIYTKHSNVSLLLNPTAGSDVLCGSSSMVESTNRCTSPTAPLNLATEEQFDMTASGSTLTSTSVYETSHLRTLSRVVMVTGLDEAVATLLNSHGMDGNGDSRGEGGGSGSGEEDGSGGKDAYSEGLMMFPEPGNSQHVEANYLDFEPCNSLHIADGIVHYGGNDLHVEDVALRLNDGSRVLQSSTALMIESNKSGLEGFLRDGHTDEVQLLGADGASQPIVHVVDVIQSSGPSVFRLVTNPDGTVSLVPLPSVQLSRQQGQDEDDVDSGVQLVHVETIDVKGPPPVLPFKQSMKLKKLLPGCPAWALALNDCERIGDSFRGWVETDAELDTVMTYFRQVTHSYWGTRQSPSQSKPSTRLMWKSQYVPFDGIPFINAGSRAVVMECQYGPRRQSNAKRLTAEADPKKVFKQSCPARVYVKKVRKFPEFAVDCELDKKQLKAAMDQAFHSLRENNLDKMGEDRFYIQLPTEAAHEFHSESPDTSAGDVPHRLHPKVSEKLREIVSNGEIRLYPIRNMLRRFVEKELFEDSETPPARHDLTYFPTVNDLQNNIHQAIHDIETGILPFNIPTVNIEINASCERSHSHHSDEVSDSRVIESNEDHSSQSPYAQKVTVTLCARPGEDGHHVISKVETLMSDGRIVTSSSLPPELAHIISKVPHTDDADQSDVAESILLSDSHIPNDPYEHSSADPFTASSHSNKFSVTHYQETTKSENEEISSHFALGENCGDVAEEEFCVTEHWRKDFGLRIKRNLDSDLTNNGIHLKRRKVN